MAGQAAGQGVRSRSQHQRRKRIVQAAAALASRGGIEAMQMRTVSERAGVALGTLYRYFPSKMDLVVAVVSEEIDLLEGSIERRPPAAAPPRTRGRGADARHPRPHARARTGRGDDPLLLLSDVKTDFGERMSGLLLRAASGPPESPMRRSAPPRGRALSGIWTMEMIEMLRGNATAEEIQSAWRSPPPACSSTPDRIPRVARAPSHWPWTPTGARTKKVCQ